MTLIDFKQNKGLLVDLSFNRIERIDSDCHRDRDCLDDGVHCFDLLLVRQRDNKNLDLLQIMVENIFY